MIVTTGAGTLGYNYCVELHWYLSFHKFDVKKFSDWEKKNKKQKQNKNKKQKQKLNIILLAWRASLECIESLLDQFVTNA